MKHPIQPIIDKRFKSNKIIEYLFETKETIDLNKIRSMYHLGMVSLDDMLQFHQLIGYSVDGFYSLSFVQEAVEKGEFPDEA